MISDKIKAVFQFIDFLHTNTDTFKQYLPQVKQALDIKSQGRKLRENDTFQNRIKSKEFDTKKNKLFDEVKENVVDVIIAKGIEFDICYKQNRSNVGYSYEFNWGRDEIYELRQNSEENDLKTILGHKNKYAHFRTETNTYFLALSFFFQRLDEYLKELFEYFDQNTQTEFETFLYKDELDPIVKERLDAIFLKPKMTSSIKASSLDISNESNHVKNPHPSFFEDDVFYEFELWMRNSNDPMDKRLSFIYQKLKKENKLRITDFKKFSKWAFDNNYLNDFYLNNLEEKGHFHQPTKILTPNRLDIFNALKLNNDQASTEKRS